jgi:hypothetical protein
VAGRPSSEADLYCLAQWFIGLTYGSPCEPLVLAGIDEVEDFDLEALRQSGRSIVARLDHAARVLPLLKARGWRCYSWSTYIRADKRAAAAEIMADVRALPELYVGPHVCELSVYDAQSGTLRPFRMTQDATVPVAC